MPHPVLHVCLALEALDRWRSDPACAPFPVDAPGVENHMLHGALAPDMGFFPGCDGRLSQLFHTGGSSSMARTLLALSQSPRDLAFTWGWISHVLADVEIHPHINAAAVDLLHAEGQRSPSHGARRQAHVRVEAGVDAWYFASASRLRRTRLAHAFDARGIELPSRAFSITYDATFPCRRLLSFHRNVTIHYNAYLRLAALIAAEFEAGVRRPLRLSHVRAIATRVLDRRSTAFGFLEPVAPAEPLLARVHTAIAQFHARLSRLASNGIDDLMDYNLETGAIAQGSELRVPVMALPVGS